MSESSLAYLILVHDQPAQLSRLVQALNSPRARFHIHVDEKADLRAFQSAVAPSANVHYVRNRLKVEWMGFSIVEATLRMVRDAMRHEFAYALLLSGADYPIKSAREIESFYLSATEEFLCFWRLEDRPDWLSKIQYLYPIDLIPIRGWSQGTKAPYWQRLFWGRWMRYRRLMPQRKFLSGMVPYGGPDWWSLSKGCLAEVLRFVDTHPSFSRFYRQTASPGEMFFQTAILNSPFAQQVRNHAAYGQWRLTRARVGESLARLPEESFNLRYIDWSGELAGTREAPAVLDERDWEALRGSRCHFARKFEPVRSATLLDRLDSEVHGAQDGQYARA